MKSTGRIISLMIIVFMLLNTIMPVMAFAEEPSEVIFEEISTNYKIEAEKEWDVSAKKDGSAIAKWNYSDKSLTISGSGVIRQINYGIYGEIVEKIVIEEGITGIGEVAFSYFTNVKSVFIADSVETIGKNSFSNCSTLESFELPPHIKVVNNNLNSDKKITELIIPNEVETISVTGFNKSGITSLSLPASVKNIKTDDNSNNIKTVFIDDENQYYTDIDGVVYDKEVKTLIYYPAGKEDKTYVVPESVTKIGDYAFAYNGYIKKVELPDSLTEIGKSAFKDCSSLREINLPSGITSIEEYTFYECESLNGVVLPDGITSLGRSAFERCKSLESINIPIGVRIIPEHCFYGCEMLRNVKFSTGLRQIWDGAFSGCFSLIEMTLPKGLNLIAERAFEGSRFSSINIPTSVGYLPEEFIISDDYTPTTIICETNSAAHDYAETHKIHYILTDDGEEENVVGSEYKLEKTKTWDVSENQESEDKLLLTWNFDDRSFTISGKGKMKDYYDIEDIPYVDYLGVVKKVIIESGEKDLSRYAFPYTPIKEVIVSRDYKYDENNERIYEPIDFDQAFYRCNNIEKMVLSKDVYSLGIDISEERLLKEIDYDGEGEYVIIDNIVYDYDLDTIYRCLSDKAEITIPDSVKTIDSMAFYNCKNLEKVIIPDSVETIYSSAFSDCINLREVKMSKNLKRLDDSIFYNCQSLKSVELPNLIQKLSHSTFENCFELENVVWPESIKEIPQSTFEGCISLTNIKLPDTLTSIGGYGFSNCKKLKNIQLPNSLTNIGWRAFEGAGLNNIELPSSLRTIDTYAFMKCEDLEFIKIPSEVTSINNGIFSGCLNLRSIDIPKGVTEINTSAFDDCISLESINLEEGNENYIVKDGALYRLEDNCLFFIPQEAKNSLILEDIDTFNTKALKTKNMVIVKKNSPAHKYAEEKKIGYLMCSVESDECIVDDTEISKITPNTKVEDVGEIMNIDAADYKFLSKDGTELDKDGLIGTNGKLVLYDKVEYDLIVKGDLNGDGKVTVSDLATVQRSILDEEYELDERAFKAADKNSDSSITVSDLASVQRYILTGTGL